MNQSMNNEMYEDEQRHKIYFEFSSRSVETVLSESKKSLVLHVHFNECTTYHN